MSSGVYRAGPWPGLTARGAGVLLGCAALLAIGQGVVGAPRGPWPDLPLLTLASLVPLALAARITGVAGAASAACGAYLLPRSLLSLVDPSLPPPPLLLAPAIVFDLALSLRPAHLADLRDGWPGRRPRWRKRLRRSAEVRPGVRPARAAMAGTLFGLVLAAVVPPWAVLLGADPLAWPAADLTRGAAACAALGGLVGLVGLAGLSARGTGS